MARRREYRRRPSSSAARSALNQIQSDIAHSPLPGLTPQQGEQFKNALAAAESTGLQPKSFNGSLEPYLLPARAASEYGYSAAFLAVSMLCLVALVLMIRLVRKPPDLASATESATAGNPLGLSQDIHPRTGQGDRSSQKGQ